ncbi:MAG: ABC transporter permease [Planctomycetota bacterium]
MLGYPKQEVVASGFTCFLGDETFFWKGFLVMDTGVFQDSDPPPAETDESARSSKTFNSISSASQRLLAFIDRWSEKIGDSVNPILVKEMRQALKSRQFLVTFSLLLLAALGWTIIGSLMRMPQIYTTPTGPFMLVGYYVVLAVPMLLVVPLAAYRSLESEIDDGTLELLSISVLSPWQIVLGKLSSAALQMTLYFVALFPCVAFAYTLRGVDLPTLVIVMGFLLVSGLMLTTLAICLAPQSRSRNGRIVTLLMVISILLLGEYGIGTAAISMLRYGIPFESEMIWFTVVFALLTSLALGHLLVTTTAMMLTPESENRSTRIRVALLILTAVLVGLNAYSVQAFGEIAIVFGIASMGTLLVLWMSAAAMMVAESPSMTPRIRRELPATFVSRMLLTFFTPGPATGLVFGCIGVVTLLLLMNVGVDFVLERISLQRRMGSTAQAMKMMSWLFAAYVTIFLTLSRVLVALVRKVQNVRVEFGLASLAIIGVLSALVPYSAQVYMEETMQLTYSNWQITNWVWTISEAAQSRLPEHVPIIVGSCAAATALLAVGLSSGMVAPQKLMVPERVRQEELQSTRG